jgi:protein TonB
VRGIVLAFLAALAIHALILLFGGVFFFTDEEAAARAPVREVELFSEEQTEEKQPEKEKPNDEEKPPVEEVAQPEEQPPDMRQIVDAAPEPQPDTASTDAIARLDALSLSALESALDPSGGGGEFSSGVNLASGGRIGGTGAAGAGGGGDDLSAAFDVGELDQRARPIFQAAPAYPFELRQKKVEGVVYMLFIVDKDGRVVNPKVEKSDHPAFERPALDAVRQWKFEPAVRGGEKVASKVRIPIRFSISG